jgi:DNA polymerase
MSSDDKRLKARARLALRAEQAFGLNFIPQASNQPASEAPSSGNSETPQNLEQAGSSSRFDTVDLFGTPAAARSDQSHPSRSVPLTVSTTPFTAPELSVEEKRQRLIAMDNNEVRCCTRCRLHETRTQTVFGEGAPDAKIFFIGEGPGENEDRTGRPFVGRAGQLLDKQINAMGLKRRDVYIANIVKCRPPGNREPAPDEVATCAPYLERQLEIIRPKVIVTLGRPATQHMLQTKQSMSRLRGQWHEWRGIRLMPTFHPAYLLRSYTRENREMVWNDLKEVMREVGLKAPARGVQD